MKLSTRILLPLVAASLRAKKNSDKNRNFPFDPLQLTWNKSDLVNFVTELRHMAMSDRSFSNLVNVEEILMKSQYTNDRNDDYYMLLSQKIVTLAEEAKFHGVKIDGAFHKLLESIESNDETKLFSRFMESNNSELKALVLSKVGMNEGIWNQYFPKIENDQRAQRRLLELIDMEDLKHGRSILKNWGKSLKVSAEEIEANFKLSEDKILKLWGMNVIIPFYIWHSLQLRNLQPNEVVLGLVSNGNFEVFLDNLVNNEHLPSENIEFKIKLIPVIFQVHMCSLRSRLFSKVTFDDSDFDSKVVVLKTASKNFSVGSDYKRFVLKSVFDLRLDLLYKILKEEEIMKIYRSGFVETFSTYFNNQLRANMSQESVMKVGVIAARFVAEIASSPTKYSWANPQAIDILLETARTAIEICRISYYSDNPLTNALKYAFESGILVDFYSRYKNTSLPNFCSLVRNVYSREVKLFFAYKRLTGDKFYANLDSGSPLYEFYHSEDTPTDFKYLAYSFTKREEQENIES